MHGAHTWVRYTTLRLLLFVAAILGLWFAGLRDPLLVFIGGAVISMIVSVFLLSGMRRRMSEDIADRIERRTEQKAARRHSEDELAEDAEGATPRRGSTRLSTETPEDPDAFR